LRNPPDVIVVSEVKLKITHQLSSNISLCGCSFVHADTENNAGGVRLYIKKSLLTSLYYTIPSTA